MKKPMLASSRLTALAAGVCLVMLAMAMPIAGAEYRREFRERTGPGQRMFRLPLENPGGVHFSGPGVNLKLDLMGVDHHPKPGNSLRARASCRDYKGRMFPHCYGNHRGSDFILKGGWKAMDRLEGRVVAAADGEVVKVDDGNYDRCRASILKMEVTCKGHEKKANMVEILHPGGYHTLYYHFKKNTIVVKPGDHVKCGDFLGNVGSSGESSLPHLHFEVVDPEGFSVDPFAADPADSLWVMQDGPFGLPAETCKGE